MTKIFTHTNKRMVIITNHINKISYIYKPRESRIAHVIGNSSTRTNHKDVIKNLLKFGNYLLYSSPSESYGRRQLNLYDRYPTFVPPRHPGECYRGTPIKMF